MTVAVLLAVGLFAAWNVLIPGVDAWENIVAAVIGSLRLTGPVAAAFAAWVALRKRRALRGRSLTTWRALKAPLAIVMVVVGSFGATVLVLAVKTVLTDQSGRLSLTGLAMGMAGLALYSVIGWVAGWVLPRPFTPPLAGLACYGVFSWLADDRGWADKLAPGTGEPYDLFQGLNGAPFFDQTIWLLGITAALLLGWAALVTRQALVLACALLAVLTAGMGVSRVLAQPKPAAAVDIAYTCQEWPITVCMHPGMRAGLTELGAAFTQIASRLAGTPAAFTRVEQRPLDDPLKPSNGLAPVHVPDLSSGFAEEAAHEYIEALAPRCQSAVAEGYRQIVVAWLRGEPLPGTPLPEHHYATTSFSSWSEHQRREWLRMFYSDFQGCRLSSTHFGGGPSHAQVAPSVRPTPESSHVYPVYPGPSGATPAGSAPAAPGTPGTGATPGASGSGYTREAPAERWTPDTSGVSWPVFDPTPPQPAQAEPAQPAQAHPAQAHPAQAQPAQAQPREATPAQAAGEGAPAQPPARPVAQAQAGNAAKDAEQVPASHRHPAHGSPANGHGWGAKMSPKGWQ
ncbi:hypothetical protein FXF51_14705 [Nonomuraea sp. PA05]|uniref:hypothetical protein n=1 Tax=Nonomuraea sp. PA05 TaxID=2604466 RepID=UPI0011D66BCE|nr:hypothetical protein [Nonomuraea sp. PA05]TYB67141.1 hypothetical protein FXF51_14705 [Nonomuraea sp. PA05]